MSLSSIRVDKHLGLPLNDLEFYHNTDQEV